MSVVVIVDVGYTRRTGDRNKRTAGRTDERESERESDRATAAAAALLHTTKRAAFVLRRPAASSTTSRCRRVVRNRLRWYTRRAFLREFVDPDRSRRRRTRPPRTHSLTLHGTAAAARSHSGKIAAAAAVGYRFRRNFGGFFFSSFLSSVPLPRLPFRRRIIIFSRTTDRVAITIRTHVPRYPRSLAPGPEYWGKRLRTRATSPPPSPSSGRLLLLRRDVFRNL